MKGRSIIGQFGLKQLLTMIVMGLVGATIATDFDDLVISGWDIPLKTIGFSSSQEWGVKAAVLAMCAAAALFVSLIPREDSKRGRIAHLSAQATGGISALGAGWYWLISEAGNSTGPYLFALAPMFVILGMSMAVSMYISWVGVRDDRQEEPRLRWLDLGGFVLLLIAISAVFYLMWRLPSFLFAL